MSSSQGNMNTAVMEPPQLESADATLASAHFPLGKSGLESVRELERADIRAEREELCQLAMRIAVGSPVDGDEISAILSDCGSTTAKLDKRIAKARKILVAKEKFATEADDARSLEEFHAEADSQLAVLRQNLETLRFLMVQIEAQFKQIRRAAPTRKARSENIAAEASAAAASLNGIDCSLFGVETPVRTSAAIREIGLIRRRIDWTPANFLGDVGRMSDALSAEYGPDGLPAVTPLEAPPEMIEALRKKREAAEKRSEEIASEVAGPSGELSDDAAPLTDESIDKPMRQSAGIAPGDLDDESFDIDQPLDD